MIKIREEPIPNLRDKELEILMEGRSPSEIERVRDNRIFLRRIHEKPVPKEKQNVPVFGVRDVNINAILKDNIWNRSIFTTDHLCRVAFGMTYEQLRKYLAQKRKKPFEHWMLILLILGCIAAIVIIVILMNVDLTKVFG